MKTIAGFNFGSRVLSDSEIKVLEKCLDFAPIQGKIDEPKLRKDLNEFCRRMRIKWNFRNESSQDFSETLLLERSLRGNRQKVIPTLKYF